MKRIFITLAVSCVFVFAGIIFAKPAIRGIARKQLENIFSQSKASIRKCVFYPAGEIRLADIEIIRENIYSIRLTEAVIQYNLLSILKPGHLKLFLKHPEVNLTILKKGVLKSKEYLNLGRGAPIFQSVDVTSLNLKANIFGMPELELENGSLRQDFNSGQADFRIAGLKYAKLKLTDIKGKAKLSNTGFSVYDLSGSLLGGNIQADLEIQTQGQLNYLLNLKCAGVDIERLVNDFNLREKFEMTGRISGELKLKGSGAQIELLAGNFSTLSPGGTLIITDMKFLEGMARNTSQPIDLLVESFKNYHYNDSLISLGFEDGSVILKTELKGETGRRNLNVVFHDFKIGGGTEQ
ncbi:MAG: YdbH domain-containing protein [Candidatus Omnitrophota bacterium]